MFEAFKKGNECWREQRVAFTESDLYSSLPKSLLELFREFGACSVRKGIYRILDFSSSVHWAIIVETYFPPYKGKIIPFAFDWMGRQFCLHRDKPNIIFMFDPATHEDLWFKQSLVDFHNIDLVDDSESVLADGLFESVLKHLQIEKLPYNECIGYKIPLFLNGKDQIDNLERISMEVYWEFQCQLFDQIKNLPEGTKISTVKFNERK